MNPQVLQVQLLVAETIRVDTDVCVAHHHALVIGGHA
jgi:hypothetical protein